MTKTAKKVLKAPETERVKVYCASGEARNSRTRNTWWKRKKIHLAQIYYCETLKKKLSEVKFVFKSKIYYLNCYVMKLK